MKWMKELAGFVMAMMVLIVDLVAWFMPKPIAFSLQKFAAVVGYGGKVMISAATVAEIGNWKGDWSTDMLETTKFADNGWKSFIAGLKEWSGSFEGNWDMTDTSGQKALHDAWIAGTSVALKLYVDSTHYYSGTAFVKKVGVETPVDDKVSVAYEFQGTGALAYT